MINKRHDNPKIITTPDKKLRCYNAHHRLTVSKLFHRRRDYELKVFFWRRKKTLRYSDLLIYLLSRSKAAAQGCHGTISYRFVSVSCELIVEHCILETIHCRFGMLQT